MRIRSLVTFVVCGIAVVVGCGVQPLDLNGKTCPCDDAAGYSCDTHTNKCVATSCAGKTCLDLGIQCGAADDTCGRYLPCGDCATGLQCNGNICECKSNSCAALAAQCGSIPDGCVGRDAHDCGACPAGQTCGGGGDHKCGQNACTPKRTCAPADCGQVSDGCGGVLTCPACCVPKTCAVLGWSCGSGPDQCGGTAVCPGVCPVASPVCTADHKCCRPITCTTDVNHCGANGPDGCGGLLQCGKCDAGTCNETTHRC